MPKQTIQKRAKSTKKVTIRKNKGFFNFLSSQRAIGVLLVLGFALVGAYTTVNIFAASSLKPVPPNSRFAWLLQGSPNPAVMDAETGPKVYDFDYLNSSASQIASIKAKGVTVICYFSAGTDEDWRPDHSQFKAGDTFGQLPGWEGELIVDTRSANVRTIMANRIQTMNNLGCDGIEPDNIDAYTNSNSIPLNETTTLDYMQFLTDTAHSYNMSIALKNGGDLVNKKLPNGKTVMQAHDFAVVEQCYEYNECDAYQPFIAANKAVFIVEYKGTASTWASSVSCKDANAKNYDAYLMNLNLNGPRTPCRTSGGTSVTPPSNQPPTISISSPANSQQFASGSTITIAANASDSDGLVSKVQFYNGAISLAVDTVAPYSTTVSGLTAGSYTLKAVATDNTSAINNTATSTVTVTVLNPTAPVPTQNIAPVVNLQTLPTSIDAPATFTLVAGATDQDGTITKVEFYSGTVKIGEDTTSPYSTAINSYPAGTYAFSAKAFDNIGLSTTSKTTTVTVTKPIVVAPIPTPSPSPAPTSPSPSPSASSPVWPAGATMKSGFHNSWWKNNCAFQSRCKVYVKWPYATDDVRVTGYEVWRSIGTKPAIKLYVNGSDDPYYTESLSKNTEYSYKIYALDRDGNRSSGLSKTVNINCTLLICSL